VIPADATRLEIVQTREVPTDIAFLDVLLTVDAIAGRAVDGVSRTEVVAAVLTRRRVRSTEFAATDATFGEVFVTRPAVTRITVR
jgi:hypothetical protein